MKIIWIKIVELLATTVLPMAVDLLVNLLKDKISSYEEKESISI